MKPSAEPMASAIRIASHGFKPTLTISIPTRMPLSPPMVPSERSSSPRIISEACPIVTSATKASPRATTLRL